MKRVVIASLVVLAIGLGTWCGVEVLVPRPAGEGAAQTINDWLREGKQP